MDNARLARSVLRKMASEDPQRCERCGESLNHSRMEWLELNFMDNRYGPIGSVRANESQGCFPFGKACARAVLANGGALVRIAPKRKRRLDP